MARTDWIALVTAPSAEYAAAIDLERFCLHPYLPQQCRRTLINGLPKLRRFPLFPRYILLPVPELDYRVLRTARGVLKTSPVLSDREGRIWRAPAKAIDQIKAAEESGNFDEKLEKGAKVRIRGQAFSNISAFIEATNHGMVELFTPLLGGSRLRTKAHNVVISPVP
jgi:hypothetical protein